MEKLSENLTRRLAQFDATLPLEEARTLPREWYFDTEIYELEMERVFLDSWQWIARSSQLTQPGSFVTTAVAGEPVVVVRDEAGKLGAYANVCRHKAAQVVNESCGQLAKLRCWYHGWTYNLRGELIGTPEFDGVRNFCKEQNGLPPYRVEERAGMVFVHFGKDPAPIEGLLGSYLEQAATLNLTSLAFVERREYLLDCNWKVFVDNYLDGGYHVNTVHPALADVIDYKNYRVQISDSHSVQVSPLKPARDPSVAKVRSGNNAYYWWFYPNLMINVYDGVLDTNLVLPEGTDRCRVIFDFYFAQTEGDEAKKFISDSLKVAEQVQQEDVRVCMEVQRGLHSRTYRAGRFSARREAGGYAFHQLLARKLQS